MALRPSWEGHLRLSLVTCPVALYPATSEAETVRFNYINPQTSNRFRMKTVDAGTGEELSRGDLVKGFEIAKGEYVLLDKDDFEQVKLESTRIIDIEKFVPRDGIDRRELIRYEPQCELRRKNRDRRAHYGWDDFPLR
jgi:DNA end-binding protein Ku